MLDSQTVKALFAEQRSYEGGKRIVVRKQHVAVDTDERLLMINLPTAEMSNSAGAPIILDGIRNRCTWMRHLFADGAYDRTWLMDKAAFLDRVLEIELRSDRRSGFEVISRRRVVERTFDWMIRCRQIIRDNEKRLDVYQPMIHVPMGSLVLRQIAHR